MAKIYDTKGKLLTGDNNPQLTFGKELLVVDNRRNTWKKVDKIFKDTTIEDQDEEMLKIVLGEEQFKKVEEANLPVAEYQELITYVFAAIFGMDYEEAKEQLKRSKESK